MNNLFAQSRSHWVRYDRYEIKTGKDGKRYITPEKAAKPDIYNPLKEAPGIVLDALNVGMLMMNRSLEDVKGQLLIVSQFTLYGSCKKGRRPEFLSAARPEVAIPLYEKFVQLCRDKGFHTETGEFGAYMQVESLNDGPVTLVVDTDQL